MRKKEPSLTDVFISWSGRTSKKIAEELRNWIPSVLQFARPYFTPDDVEKGARWNSDITAKLESSDIGIICLTKENFQKPWILFEAGALSKNFKKSKVCSLLFGLDSADLSGPLTTFQATNFEKSDVKKLISAINETGDSAKLNQNTIDRVFEMWWPELEKNVNHILSAESDDQESKDLRSDRELLEEILLLSRSAGLSGVRNEARIAKGFISDFEDKIHGLISILERTEDSDLNDIIESYIKMYGYISRKASLPDGDVAEKMEHMVKSKDNAFLPF